MTPDEVIGSLETLQKIIDVVASPIFVKNRKHQWLVMNDAMCQFLGRPKEELIGKSDYDVIPSEQADVFWRVDDQVFATGKENVNEEELTDANGDVRTIVTHKRLIQVGDTPLLVAVITDITSFRRAEAHSRYLAYHDSLSGLPNRALLNDRIDQALARLRREPNASCALLYIDLDRFKDVNDTYGHQAGDELIREFAGRLAKLVRETDTAARLGGDEFAVLISHVDGQESVEALCTRILAASHQDFRVTGQRASVGASIGAVIAKDGDTTLNDLLRKADVALYSAKQDLGGCYRVFTEAMDEGRNQRRIIENDLREALKTGTGLAVYYQPLVSNPDEAIVGVEALLRWKHPELGSLSPLQFLPIAEETRLIVPLGEWVLRQVCSTLAKWPSLRIALNVSAIELRDRKYAKRFFSAVHEHGIDPGRIEIEITETTAIAADAVTIATLRRLRSGGVRVALDDFGTGYSSLTRLRALEIDKVKIDRSFVQSLGQSADSDAIVDAVAEIARALGLAVSVEGVETDKQRQHLLTTGCTELQGHFFSRPLPESEIGKWLSSKKASASRQVA